MWSLHMYPAALMKAFKLSQTEQAPWADGKEERIGKQIPLSICLKFCALIFLLFVICWEIFDQLETTLGNYTQLKSHGLSRVQH